MDGFVSETLSVWPRLSNLRWRGCEMDCAAEFLNVSLRTAHGYANGRPIPESTAQLLRLMVRLNLSPDEVK